MRTILIQALNSIGKDPRQFRIHGLSAGRACDLLKLDVSVETIKKLGRWKSNAVYSYLTR